LATIFIIAGLSGTRVRDAYVILTSTTIILFFIPYLYIFAAYLRLRRDRGMVGLLAGWVGMVAVLLSIGVSLVPPAVESPLGFEIKVVGGVVFFMVAGWILLVLARRSVRDPTAARPAAGLP
ncbi:MAG TPA: hypothetical protein VH163_11400, partial [Gemmatimonadales bacterium]|nr:hypothetical protein [Gemmatimonadales bacterium]